MVNDCYGNWFAINKALFYTAGIAHFKNYSPWLLQCNVPNIRNIIRHCLVLLYRYLLTKQMTCVGLVNMVHQTAWQPHILIFSTLCLILVFATVLTSCSWHNKDYVQNKIKMNSIRKTPSPPNSPPPGPPLLSHS